MEWYKVVGWILYYITLPVVWILLLLLNIVRFILSPFIYIAYLLKEACAWPFRFLAKFEPVWYFVGSAVLIGILLALSIHGVVRLFTVVFDLDRKPVPRDKPATGHSPATYRAAREEKKRKAQEKEEHRVLRAELLASHPLIQQVVKEARARPISDSSQLSPNASAPATRSGLLSTTILEHSDEEADSAF